MKQEIMIEQSAIKLDSQLLDRKEYITPIDILKDIIVINSTRSNDIHEKRERAKELKKKEKREQKYQHKNKEFFIS